MKKYGLVPITALALMFSASLATAAFYIPDWVYRIDRLQEAKGAAESAGKQIVFLYSDEHTNCSLCDGASIGILERFRRSAVIVYISKKDWPKIPVIIRKAINSPDAGRYIPKTVVVDSALTEVLAIIPYKKPGA